MHLHCILITRVSIQCSANKPSQWCILLYHCQQSLVALHCLVLHSFFVFLYFLFGCISLFCIFVLFSFLHFCIFYRISQLTGFVSTAMHCSVLHSARSSCYQTKQALGRGGGEENFNEITGKCSVCLPRHWGGFELKDFCMFNLVLSLTEYCEITAYHFTWIFQCSACSIFTAFLYISFLGREQDKCYQERERAGSPD